MANNYHEVLKMHLQKLIDQSGANFTADDVINEFKSTKDSDSSRKLITILKAITKHQPSAKNLLPNVYHLLETKHPYYCLVYFLNNYSKIHSSHSTQGSSTLTSGHIDYGFSNKNSTELVTTSNSLPKVLETVTPENVSEIKERVVQAATGGLSKSAKSTSVISGGSGVVSGSNVSTPTSSSSVIGSGTGTSSNLLPVALQKHQTIHSNSNNISNVIRSKNSFWDLSKMDLITFKNITINNIAAIPLTSQENIILYDLIYCLSGMRGNYIYPENNDCTNLNNNNNSSNNRMSNNCNIDGNNMIKFKISDQIHCSLKDILKEILPLASYYIIIQKFIQKSSISSCGQVLQALSASLRSLIHDYYLLLAQLESELLSGDLTLYKLLFYVRPTLHTMEILAETVLDIQNSDLRGGQILTLLFDKINTLTGDDESQKFLIQLTKLSAIPYMNILQLWIEKGVINDPEQEFLVEDNEVIRREELPEYYSADYWEKRYTVRRERIPNFLEKLSDIILRTGKYLNVIRQCGKNVQSPQTLKKIQFSPINQNYMTIIQNSYYFASKNLLEVLIKENDLMGHLQSVKRYLLLYQGDFISQFMDACEDELSKNVDKVLPMKIENLLGLILRLSSAKHDPYKDDLHCEFLTYDLATQMLKIINNEEEYWQVHDRIDLYGLECFAFKYDVKWPISLVLNHIAISKYQMLFRQLLYCKHVERQLCKVWKENNTAKKFSPQSAELYRSAFTLRQRMMNAIQNLEYYMMIEVIEPNWHIFIENMKKVENVDDVLIVHQDFLDLCLKNCMLTDPTLLRSIIKLNNICLNFCEFIQKAQRYFSDAELSSMLCESDDDNSESDMDLSSHKQSESSLAPTETFSERVRRFDLEFTGLLIGFLKQINDVALNNPSDRFINLVYRINFNSFYNDQMDKLCAKDSMAPSHHKN